MDQRSERNLLIGIAAISFAVAAAVVSLSAFEGQVKIQKPSVAAEKTQRGALVDWFANGGVFHMAAGSYGLIGAAAAIKAVATHRKMG